MKNRFKKMQLAARKNGKKGVIFGTTFALTLIGLSVCVPKLGIHADPVDTATTHPSLLGGANEFNSSDYAMIEIGGGATEITEADGDDETVTVNFTNGTLTIAGTNLYSNTTMNANNRYEVYTLGDVTLTATPNENYSGDLRENGNLLGSNTVEYTGLVAGDIHIIDVEFTEQGGGQDPVVPALEDIEFDLSWTNSFINTWINDVSVIEESDDYQSTSFNYTGIVVPEAGTTNSEENNVIRLQPRFGDYPVTEYNINGVNYTSESPEVTIDNEGSWFITVPGSAKYIITGVGDSGIAVPRTIIWANVDVDTSAEEYEEDMRLEHGKAKVVAIYDGETAVAGETDVDENGMGWVQVTPGNKVLFEFVPEYGYQLTAVSANGLPLEPQDTMNQYIFEMPDTNVHFSATFERVEDVVEANSEKITSGSIAIDGALQGGTAQLTVNDVELGTDKIAGFENAAGDYAISNYLDIDLYNIFYKANSDDDVWSEKIDELDQEVTITIQLAEGIDANDIVIVHNIHDGEEYEIIPIDSYDPSTNTITFKTRSFSSYAIAGRTAEEESTESDDNATATTTPNTGAATSSESLTAVAISGTAIASIILVGLTVLYIKKKIL